MTIEQVKEQKNRHLRASETLQIRLQSKDLSGKEKHEIMCHHRLKYGRHPFACPNCWSYLPVCVCDLVEKNLHQEVPDDGTNNLLQVVVWTHHREWGLTSNTGSILALAIPNYCQLLMKGLPEHDKILEETILQDENCLAVVLWPDQSKRKEGNNKDEDETPSSIISLDQVKDEIRKNQRRVVLIAVDGTWRNARRMVARLPPTVPRLDLSADIVFSDDSSHDGRSSILAPLRTRGESGGGQDSDGRQVCTAEAVVGALMSLGTLDQHQGRHVLDVTRTKIERIGRYRGAF